MDPPKDAKATWGNLKSCNPRIRKAKILKKKPQTILRDDNDAQSTDKYQSPNAKYVVHKSLLRIRGGNARSTQDSRIGNFTQRSKEPRNPFPKANAEAFQRQKPKRHLQPANQKRKRRSGVRTNFREVQSKHRTHFSPDEETSTQPKSKRRSFHKSPNLNQEQQLEAAKDEWKHQLTQHALNRKDPQQESQINSSTMVFQDQDLRITLDTRGKYSPSPNSKFEHRLSKKGHFQEDSRSRKTRTPS